MEENNNKKIVHFGGSGTQFRWFWQPEGLKRVGKWLAYLVTVAIATLLLALLPRQCQSRHTPPPPPDQATDPSLKPVAPEDSLPLLVDSTKIDDPIDNPVDPIDNPVPPLPNVDTTTIIEDPYGKKMVNDRLGVIIKDMRGDDSKFNDWQRQFKAAYPGNAYKIIYKEPVAKLLLLEVPKDERETIKNEIHSKIKGIDFEVFDYEIMSPVATKPTDPIFSVPVFNIFGYDWYFKPIQAYDAWDITKGSSSVRVAIIDSYFDLKHMELNSNRIVLPYSVERGNRNVAPPADMQPDYTPFFHGTMVASLAIGNMDNGAGACGIAPYCEFMPISLGEKGMNSFGIACALLRAIHSGADVVNLSLGNAFNMTQRGVPYSDQIEISKQYGLQEQALWDYIYTLADMANVTIVYAAGNATEYIGLDAAKRNPDIINVSSVDMDLHWSSLFSNVGNFKEYGVETSTISAPGEFMFGAKPFRDKFESDLNSSMGTSYAAPLVTGAVALMKSVDNSLTNKEIINILKQTGKKVKGEGGDRIGKLLQIRDALDMVKKGMATFDDFVNNPIGLWGSVKQDKAYETINERTGETGPYVGQIRHYYEITQTQRNNVCGEQIVYQVTAYNKLAQYIMKDNMVSVSDITRNAQGELEFRTRSLSSDGTLTDGKHDGFYGFKHMTFHADSDGSLVVTGKNKWGQEYSIRLKRVDKIVLETQVDKN